MCARSSLGQVSWILCALVSTTSMDRHSNIKIKRGWTKLKPNLLMALQTTEAALDGLPIPGAKACIRLVLHFMTLSDVRPIFAPLQSISVQIVTT